MPSSSLHTALLFLLRLPPITTSSQPRRKKTVLQKSSMSPEWSQCIYNKVSASRFLLFTTPLMPLQQKGAAIRHSPISILFPISPRQSLLLQVLLRITATFRSAPPKHFRFRSQKFHLVTTPAKVSAYLNLQPTRRASIAPPKKVYTRIHQLYLTVYSPHQTPRCQYQFSQCNNPLHLASVDFLLQQYRNRNWAQGVVLYPQTRNITNNTNVPTRLPYFPTLLRNVLLHVARQVWRW